MTRVRSISRSNAAMLCAASIAIAVSSGAAEAQQYRPDAEGYPCGAKPRLTIAQGEHGFSIQPVADRPQRLRRPVQNLIDIGASIKLDAAILKRPVPANREGADAERR